MEKQPTKVVESVKLLAGITDDKQDGLIEVLEQMTRDQLAAMVDADEVPHRLESIVLPVVVARYNRLGNEGQSSFSQEGESIRYPASDFDPYIDLIRRYNADGQRGSIVFFTKGDDGNEI